MKKLVLWWKLKIQTYAWIIFLISTFQQFFFENEKVTGVTLQGVPNIGKANLDIFNLAAIASDFSYLCVCYAICPWVYKFRLTL